MSSILYAYLNFIWVESLGKGKAEAKGKVEKRFDYFQRRIPFLCEKYKVKKLEEAQRLLDEEVSYYNDQRKHAETEEIPTQRWERAIREGKGKIKPLDPSVDLEIIFSLHYDRTVKKDGRLSFQGRLCKIGSFPGQKVTVCLIPERKIIVIKGSQKIYEAHL